MLDNKKRHVNRKVNDEVHNDNQHYKKIKSSYYLIEN